MGSVRGPLNCIMYLLVILRLYLIMMDMEGLIVALKLFNCISLRIVKLFIDVKDDEIVYAWCMSVL